LKNKMEIRKITNNKSRKCNPYPGFQLSRRNLLKSKCSQGHVEMILSFAIFMGFIITMLYFLNPLKVGKVNYTILDMTENVLSKEWLFDYNVTSVTVKSDIDYGGKDCFKVNNPGLGDGNLIVKDESGDLIAGTLDSTGILLSKPGNNKRYYRIFASDIFSEQTPDSNCVTLTEVDDYNFGSLNSYQAVSYEAIEATIDEYGTTDAEYLALKERLGLQTDFAISVYNVEPSGPVLDRDLSATIFVPRVVEVVARDIPLIALTDKAEQRNIIINLRAW